MMGLLFLGRLKRPRLRVPDLDFHVPRLSPSGHREALAAQEEAEPRIIPGAEACVRLAPGMESGPTKRVYLYLHGLSACRQETSPVTERLADQDRAHAIFARVAGHGMGNQAMGEVDGAAWLESVWHFWLRAVQMGNEVVIVATSTGAAYATWLLSQKGVEERVAALMLMSPNFKVRRRLAFLLTWPGAEWFLPQVVSRDREWQDRNPRQERYWATNYGNQALIQMQLVLQKVRSLRFEEFRVPLMVQASADDPVVNVHSAHRVYQRWGGRPRHWRWVEISPGESAHVFVGDIMAPHRNDEVIMAFRAFLMATPGYADREPTSAQ